MFLFLIKCTCRDRYLLTCLCSPGIPIWGLVLFRFFSQISVAVNCTSLGFRPLVWLIWNLKSSSWEIVIKNIFILFYSHPFTNTESETFHLIEGGMALFALIDPKLWQRKSNFRQEKSDCGDGEKSCFGRRLLEILSLIIWTIHRPQNCSLQKTMQNPESVNNH